MIFKTQRESDEYKQLQVMNPRMFNVLNCIAAFAILEFNKSITLTSIYRTQQEHEELYKTAVNPPKTSVHCQWEGCDIRSSDFTLEEINKMVVYLNCFTFRNGKPTAMYHTVNGNAPHFHIQVGRTR